MDCERRDAFLTAYETSRSGADLTVLEQYLSDQLVFEDPQLDRGRGSREVFLALTRALAEETEGLQVRRHGPVCVSEDGSWFTQRWLGRRDLTRTEPEAPEPKEGM